MTNGIVILAQLAADQHAARVKQELARLADSMKRGLGQRVRWQYWEWEITTGRRIIE